MWYCGINKIVSILKSSKLFFTVRSFPSVVLVIYISHLISNTHFSLFTMLESVDSMEVPSNQAARKSVVPGASTLDRKTINKILGVSQGNKNSDDGLDSSKHPSMNLARGDLEGPITKYQKERNSQGAGANYNPNIHQALLDSSAVFRARTAIPHGLLFDIHEEVYEIIEDLHEEYKKCTTVCGVRVSDSEMEELVDDAQNALQNISKHIGRDCEARSAQEFSTNKMYADAKKGIVHSNNQSEESTNHLNM